MPSRSNQMFSCLFCCCSREINRVTSSDSTSATTLFPRRRSGSTGKTLKIHFVTADRSEALCSILSFAPRLCLNSTGPQEHRRVEAPAATCADSAPSNQHIPTHSLTVTLRAFTVSLPDTMGGSASQARSYLGTKKNGRERERKCWKCVVKEVNKSHMV